MEKIFIIIVDDQREVLDTVYQELAGFDEKFNVEECESAEEVMELMEDIDANGDYPAVIISDHVMPGKSGVELLTEISADIRFEFSKKILLTGLATHEDTINAINNADIDRYIEKPWKPEALVKTVKVLLTRYILAKGIDYNPYMDYLDQETLLKGLRDSTGSY